MSSPSEFASDPADPPVPAAVETTAAAAAASPSVTEDVESHIHTSSIKDSNHIRIKVKHNGQCTLIGFDRSDRLKIRDLVGKTCSRMNLTKPILDYALFVSHGKTNIRAFDTTDLKDGDECELVYIEEEIYEEGDYDDVDNKSLDSNEDDDDDDDDDDKTVPMSAEKPAVKPPPLPPQRQRNASSKNAGKQSSGKREQLDPPPSSSSPTKQRRTTSGAVTTAGSSETDPSVANKSNKVTRLKNSKLSTSKDLIELTETNQKSLEKGSLLIFEQFGDGHFHEAIFQKYQPPDKQLKEPKKCWVFVDIIDPDGNIKNWVDLNSFRAFVVEEDDVLTMEKDNKPNSLLGKRMRVKWKDGNYYDGEVTKTLASDKDFIFVEYDDGDRCWSNLREELDAFELPTDSHVRRRAKQKK